jgi:hypothetical protein
MERLVAVKKIAIVMIAMEVIKIHIYMDLFF